MAKKQRPKLNGKQRELMSPCASPFANAVEMRRQYIRATMLLIQVYGWNCFKSFNFRMIGESKHD